MEDSPEGYERRDHREAIENIHHRMDTQDRLLSEIKDMLIAHVTQETTYHTALEELVTLWRGSKIIIPALLATIACLGSAFIWAKEHLR